MSKATKEEQELMFKKIQLLVKSRKEEASTKKEYNGEYRGFNTEGRVYFPGKDAGPIPIPFFCFLKDGNEIRNGIYPAVLYYVEKNILIVAYGISSDNPPKIQWKNATNKITISSFWRKKYKEEGPKYGTSYIEKSFTLPLLEKNKKQVVDSINKVIDEYELISKTNTASKSKKEKKDSSIITPLNQILYGPPGTGKTYNVINEALAIVDPNFDNTSNTDDERREVVAEFNKYKTEGRISFITFHQSYSYEDFVLGIMPDVDNQHLKFNRKKGVFYRIVEKAKNDKDNLPYVLIIDEINRANISRVFGELITLIEVDKRLGEVNELTVQLPNEKIEIDSKTGNEIVKEFGIPSNLYILGTMNTADKSIAALDIALRRRFIFKALYPDESKVKDKKLAKLMHELNKQIDNNGKDGKYYRGADFTIGHSYFMNKTIENSSEIFNNSVIPLLMEYYMNDIEMVQGILKEIELDSVYENGTIKIK